MVKKIPEHIAIIMDGNGRWANKRFLPRSVGHSEGAKNLEKILTYANKIGIKYLTVYAFSTENWKRSEEEVSTLMGLFKNYIKNEEKNFMINNIKFMVSGREENIPLDLLKAIRALEEKTFNNTGIVLNLAFNYGGRAEIIDAVNKIISSGEKEITEENFKKYLYKDIPDPELMIRTSGEYRISNFLLWQIAYSELYITEKLWPDFDEEELNKAILSYTKRDRRFGGVK
ncbi:MAG: isoprenyl transferase [Fusobacteriaceae bacterium]|jgi:undecaprenyl diphosphate synthase|nr:isoprenyl transferase [Fusobacteriaceae bacterium]MBP9510239.1 isoprenyl transferase [Fusobacteriaceae bacterium]